MSCVKENPKATPLVRNTNGTSNLLTHLKKKHPAEFKSLDAEKSTLTSRAQTPTATVSPSAAGGDRPSLIFPAARRQSALDVAAIARPKRFVPYTDAQLNNQYAAAKLYEAHGKGERPDQLKLYEMLGYKPLATRTLTSKEEQFEEELHRNIERKLYEEGVIRKDRKPLDIPIANVGFDNTPSGTKGVHIISVNLHFTDRNFNPKKRR